MKKFLFSAPAERHRHRQVVTSVVGSIVVATTLAPAVAMAAPPTPEPTSPPIAADAPWTKTVEWIAGNATPSEEIDLIEGSFANKFGIDATTDPDPHGQAGYVKGIPRLGVPEARHVDAQGIEVFAEATAFPTRLGLAASFDPEAIAAFGKTSAREGLDLGQDLIYAPQTDIARTPSWRRNMTAYSEDAYLAKRFTADEINAIQGTGLMAQVKHVGMYNGQEQSTPSLVGEQAAREMYLAPAEAAVKDGKVSSLMCSYATFQILDYQDSPHYACSNEGMLQGIIKGEWNFKGWVTTDYNAAKSTSDLMAGTDQEFLTSFLSGKNLIPLIDPASPSYDKAYADAAKEAVARIVYQYERFGLLDNAKIPAAQRSEVKQHGNSEKSDLNANVDKAEGIKQALKLSEDAAVLLKNNNTTLPLGTGGKVAVTGVSANLLPASPGGERSTGFSDRVAISPFDAMTSMAGSNVTHTPGDDIWGEPVPASALSQDSTGDKPGLTRTRTSADGTVTTATDPVLDGNIKGLVKGDTYTWTGYMNVPEGGNYRLLVQRPYGYDTGDRNAFNHGIRNVEPTAVPQGFGLPPATTAPPRAVTLTVDGAALKLSDPDSKMTPNDYPAVSTDKNIKTVAANGQYLGVANQAGTTNLTPGRHKVEISYTPHGGLASDPAIRFAWSNTDKALSAAAEAAKSNDTTVVFVDDANTTTGDGGSSPLTDVAQLAASQNRLVSTVAAAAHTVGHKVVVVLNTGSAVQMPWINDVDAVLEMWYPGQEGGTATANVLYGKVNPSGKLTMSFPVDSKQTLFAGHPERSAGTQDAGEAQKTIKWSEGLNMGYRWFTDPAANTTAVKPLFAFGHGLSYTNFSYSGLGVAPAGDGGLEVSFTVTNRGTKDGAESAQVYLGKSPDLPSGVAQTAMKMVQFGKVNLPAGTSQKLSLHVDPKDLSSWDAAKGDWVRGTGTRSVAVGAASDDLRLQTTTALK
ncbi:beta-glucosidase [Pseudarthrobacter sp. NPDC058119]|uniref:beta-glucosidase n=1 Tax=Pseudarthrobacter sp. NPDC058119 TaxID=3346348 RepID=UPI0036DEA6C7